MRHTRIGIFLYLTALNLLFLNIPGLSPQLSLFSGMLIILIGLSALITMSTSSLLCRPFGFDLSEDQKRFVAQSGEIKAFVVKDMLLPLLWATFFYALFRTYYIYSSSVWYIFQSFSTAISNAVLKNTPHPQTLGQSAIGIQISMVFVCYYAGLMVCLKKQDKLWAITGAVSVPLMTVVWLFMLQYFRSIIIFFISDGDPQPFDLQIFLLLANLFPVILISHKIKPNISSKKMGRFEAFVLLLLLLSAFSINVVYKFSIPHAKNQKIVFCDKGAMWTKPYYGKHFGQNSSGMFGILPEYLKLKGYQTELTNNLITSSILKDAGVVVVFNPRYDFTDEEQTAIYSFIENGGALLVAGDHTDVAGIMKPINRLVKPFNIALNFDTALPISSGWDNSLEKRNHYINRDLYNDYDTSIWVGASLNISPPAMPVITGKRGWADMGNYFNSKRAFLGDYKRDGKEIMGDIVLVAESNYGKGKVLVFGDTSTFQNVSIPLNYLFIDNIFKWLQSDSNRLFQKTMLIIFLVISVFATVAMIKKSASPAYIAAGILVLGIGTYACDSLWSKFFIYNDHVLIGTTKNESLMITDSSKDFHIKESTEVISQNIVEGKNSMGAVEYKFALIDAYHYGRFSRFGPKDNSLWGLSLNLMRNGYIPLFIKEFTDEILAKGDLLFIVSPTKKLSSENISRIEHFMDNGGRVIWSVGWEDIDASASGLEQLGFQVDAVPLGPGKVDTKLGSVEFVEAWPVIYNMDSANSVSGQNNTMHNGNIEIDNTLNVLAKKFDYPVIVTKQNGKGKITVIGDSQFFLSKNIETYEKYKLENIAFFKNLIQRGLK
ncbi:MAG: hypothetical protein HQK62_05060 [Desulfamplus sp.]|nr:hypothetical protein [Desulfamplus sp.]